MLLQGCGSRLRSGGGIGSRLCSRGSLRGSLLRRICMLLRPGLLRLRCVAWRQGWAGPRRLGRGGRLCKLHSTRLATEPATQSRMDRFSHGDCAHPARNALCAPLSHCTEAALCHAPPCHAPCPPLPARPAAPEHAPLVLPAGHKVLPNGLGAPHRQVWVVCLVELKVEAGAAGWAEGQGTARHSTWRAQANTHALATRAHVSRPTASTASAQHWRSWRAAAPLTARAPSC